MKISDLMICRSNAGYYIGRHYLEDDMEGDPNDGGMPYSRDSGYFRTREDAEASFNYTRDALSE